MMIYYKRYLKIRYNVHTFCSDYIPKDGLHIDSIIKPFGAEN